MIVCMSEIFNGKVCIVIYLLFMVISMVIFAANKFVCSVLAVILELPNTHHMNKIVFRKI